jgi:hypothetical protein
MIRTTTFATAWFHGFTAHSAPNTVGLNLTETEGRYGVADLKQACASWAMMA